MTDKEISKKLSSQYLIMKLKRLAIKQKKLAPMQTVERPAT
jgi:hypothetical protein